MRKHFVRLIALLLSIVLFSSASTQVAQARMPESDGSKLESSQPPAGSIIVETGQNHPGANLADRLVDPEISLVLDDGSCEGLVGNSVMKEFLFVNRYTPDPSSFPFWLEEIQVYFGTWGSVNVGDDITLLVYENTSGNTNPAVGSNFLASIPTTVQVVGAWSVYTLAKPVTFHGPGDVLIGVLAMEVPDSGYAAAALDQTATQSRSWAGWWNASPPPDTPTLPPDDIWISIDAYFPGNWMIRGYGSLVGLMYLPVVLR